MMTLSLASLFVVAALAAAPGVAPTSIDDPSEPATYVRTAYDASLWEVTADDARPITLDQWRGLGSPTYTTAKTRYVTVLTMPTVYAVTSFASGDVVREPITATEYRRAKSPKTSKAAWVPGVTGLRVVKWQTSSELIAIDPNRNTHKLTSAQWRAAGSPAYKTQKNRGFVRMSWDQGGGIAYMCDISGGRGGKLTYAQWRSYGSPTPKPVTRTSGDLVYLNPPQQYHVDSEVKYVGPMTVPYPASYTALVQPMRPLEYREWAAMGFPTPKRQFIVAFERYWCDRQAYPTPFQ